MPFVAEVSVDLEQEDGHRTGWSRLHLPIMRERRSVNVSVHFVVTPELETAVSSGFVHLQLHRLTCDQLFLPAQDAHEVFAMKAKMHETLSCITQMLSVHLVVTPELETVVSSGFVHSQLHRLTRDQLFLPARDAHEVFAMKAKMQKTLNCIAQMLSVHFVVTPELETAVSSGFVHLQLHRLTCDQLFLPAQDAHEVFAMKAKMHETLSCITQMLSVHLVVTPELETVVSSGFVHSQLHRLTRDQLFLPARDAHEVFAMKAKMQKTLNCIAQMLSVHFVVTPELETAVSSGFVHLQLHRLTCDQLFLPAQDAHEVFAMKAKMHETLSCITQMLSVHLVVTPELETVVSSGFVHSQLHRLTRDQLFLPARDAHEVFAMKAKMQKTLNCIAQMLSVHFVVTPELETAVSSGFVHLQLH